MDPVNLRQKIPILLSYGKTFPTGKKHNQIKANSKTVGIEVSLLIG